MRFSVGYQLPEEDEEPLTSIVADFVDHIGEVYFPWLDMPSGRSPMTGLDGCTDWGAQERVEGDLRTLKGMGVRLHLLLNANCYGGESLSEALANRVCSLVDHLTGTVGLDGVTTASLFVAHTLRRQFPDLDVRASVNMRIGTVRSAECVADLFTSINLQREWNRDPERIAEMRAWADAQGRALHVLANSGCLDHCPGQVFHDNLVAHEAQIAQTVNVAGWNPMVCWRHLAERGNWVALLRNSWIRPEDLGWYEGGFELVKLATRMHSNPRRVIQAYAEGAYAGNLLDLFEPSHGPLLAPYVLDNRRFPADWWERTTACGKRCEGCGYCAGVLEQVLVGPGP